MTYPEATQLQLPIIPYTVAGYHFRQRVRRKVFLWATHLGDDVVVGADTPVVAIGAGRVVWSEMRVGTEAKRNWGGIVVVGHTHTQTGSPFFSVYGHIYELAVAVGDTMTAGQTVGLVAPGLTPENGWWKTPHLHFGIYVGPWQEVILPGYKRIEERRTRLSWWREPQLFIEEYPRST